MSNRGRGEPIPLTAHLEDHERDEWLALTRFLQPIDQDPIRSYMMALSTLSGDTVLMLRLPPSHKVARWIEYFYEGYVDVLRGKAQVPKDKPEWITRLLNTGYAIPRGEAYLDEAPPEIVQKNLLVWAEIYPHLGDFREDFKDAVILAEVQDAAPVEPNSDAEPGLVEDAGEPEEPLDIDAIFAGDDEEPSASDG